MLELTLRRMFLLLLAVLLLPSCSHFSQSARQQRAYAKYVRQQSHNRVRQQTKFKKTKVPSPQASQPAISSGATDGPQSVSSGESGQQ